MKKPLEQQVKQLREALSMAYEWMHNNPNTDGDLGWFRSTMDKMRLALEESQEGQE